MTIDQAITAAVKHHQAGRLDEADRIYRAVLAQAPNNFNALHLLGAIAIQRGQPDTAVDLFQRAIIVNPNVADAHCNLGMALQSQGRVEEALASYDRAAQVNPDFCVARNNRIYALHFKPGIDEQTLHREQRLWNERFAEPLKSEIMPHRNDRDPDRRLRVGYVSPNFCGQAECFFVVPLLEHHDREHFEVHCYSSVAIADSFTALHRKHVEHWHEVSALGDRELAQRIRRDGIDILVDLTMHMAHSRLLAFARKPAPIQVTYLAYPGGTGLDAMDYRLTDRFLDPPATTSDQYTEQSIWIDNCWCCYDPLIDVPPAEARPADWQGPVWFGSLNNPCKLNPPVIELWSRLLLAVPNSRLLLLSNSDRQRQSIRQIVEKAGVEPARVEFVSQCAREKYLRIYDRIDIALDPLPYNGITTTCDTLWMGVPVVSLVGKTAAGRAGQSLLSNLELAGLVAKSPAEFVDIAMNLARDFPRLRRLRENFRRQMQSSPLMDARQFARQLESSYRQMWASRCDEGV